LGPASAGPSFRRPSEPGERLPQHVGRAPERRAFAGVHVRYEDVGRALPANDDGQRERDAAKIAGSCSRDTVSTRLSSRSRLRSSAAVTRPMAWLVAPLRWMIAWAAPRTSSPAAASRSGAQAGHARSGTPPTRALDQSATSESPCSPTTWACTDCGSTRSSRASTCRSRAVSSIVPVPMTRACGTPDAAAATCVMTSTGLVTTTIGPRAPARCAAMSLTMAALSRNRSRRLSVAVPPRPAAITTASASRMSSTAVTRRTIAAQRRPARLAGSQMHAVRVGLHALVALVPRRRPVRATVAWHETCWI
jgi:hypothetical protein